MERSGVWGSFALGCFGWLCCLLLSRGGAAARRKEAAQRDEKSLEGIVAPGFWWLAVALPLGVWAMSLPTEAPFSSGQGWGRGFLLGGGGALAAALVVFGGLSRVRGSLGGALRVGAVASLFAALPVVCVPLLWMRHAVIEALLGIALGWVAVSLVLILGLDARADAALSQAETPASSSHHSTPSNSTSLDAPHMSTHAAPDGAAKTSEVVDSKTVVRTAVSDCAALLLLNGSAFAATLCAACALGVYRDFVVATVARGMYSSVAVVLAASVALALLAGALIGEIAPGSKSLAFDAPSVLLVVTLPLMLAFGLATRILDDFALVYVVAAGVLLGFLLWWLALDARREEGELEHAKIFDQTRVPPLSILVALCGFMLGFQLMQGFGVGLMLLAAWPVSLLALPSLRRNTTQNFALAGPQASVENAGDESGALEFARRKTASILTLEFSFLAVLLLSRLFAMRFRVDLRGANFSDQYAMFGFAGGGVVPFLLASMSARPRLSSWRSTRETPGFSSVSMGRALPQVLLVGVLALALPAAMLGLWGAKVVPAFFAGMAVAAAGFSPLPARLHTIGAAFCLAIGLAVSQWAHHLAPLAELPRAQRLHFLVLAMGALLVLFLVIESGTRLMMWLRDRKRVAANIS